MSDQNLQQQQQQYMQQQQASYQGYGYTQSQLYPYNPYGQSSWDPLQHMDGPSFTGEASVFNQRRYGRSESPGTTRDIMYKSMYGGDSSRDRRSRSRSRSCGRDEERTDSGSSKRLKDTIKRLKQLEEQHYMQDQLLKDMRLSMVEESSGRGSRSSDRYYDTSYGYSSYGSSSRHSSSTKPKPSSYSSSSSSRPSSSNLDSSVMCFKCNKKGHFAKHCTAEDKLCYVCNRSGHISKECPMGPSRPDPDKACYTCGRRGHLAAGCPQSSDKSCYTCGKKGHIAADCTLGTEKHCYSCGKKGHIAADCMTDKCFKCEKSGHRAADCPVVKKIIEGKIPKSENQKCLKCSGYGHKIKMCPSMGSMDEKRKCHYCQGVGHLARFCISPGIIQLPSDKDKPKAVKIDAETKYMAAEMVKYAKTSYPVREGSKSREEIDSVLKELGTRHRIMEKELPASANKNDTTISSQLILLNKLKWKDMIYDKLIDDLYCFICTKSFASSKYYQEHVTSKEHLSFLAAVQSAKPGWAVRTKLLKKITALPSIFVGEDGGNDDDGKNDDAKTSTGEERQAIKPELYSTDAKDVKYFVCRVCHSWGETPLQNHFDSDKHKFLFENQWKCEDCNAYFRAHSDYTQHNESQLHRQVLMKSGKISASDDESGGSKKRSLDSSGDEHAGAKKKRYSLGSEEEDDALGLQFLLPVTGFYCKLCQKFYNEAKVSESDHCKGQLHQSKLQLWRVENQVASLKKGLAASGNNGKEEIQPKTAEDENKNGKDKIVEGSMEVVQHSEETEDVEVEDAAATGSGNTDEWTMDIEGEPDDHGEGPPEGPPGSEPHEAEVSSDNEEADDETVRATRRGRVTRSAKTSPKGAKKGVKKL